MRLGSPSLPAIVAIALALTGCDAAARLAQGPGPQPCDAVYDATRCDLMLDVAAEQAGVPRDQIVSISIVPERVTGPRFGGPVVTVDALLHDGTVQTATMCGGISAAFVPACMDDPHLIPASPTLDGYRDVPCAGEAPESCASAHPSVAPEAIAAARPIVLARVDIPIERAGMHEVPLRVGSLANGILTEASFAFVDDWPEGVRIRDGRVRLDVRSLEPNGRPFHNYYEHGWQDGVERVEAVLVFDVVRFEPQAILSIADVLVR